MTARRSSTSTNTEGNKGFMPFIDIDTIRLVFVMESEELPPCRSVVRMQVERLFRRAKDDSDHIRKLQNLRNTTVVLEFGPEVEI